VSAQPLPPAVLALQPPQFGTHYPLASVVLPLQTLFVAFLKLIASSRPTAPSSGSAKCLRFGHWLTLCTLNAYLYLLTKSLASETSVAVSLWRRFYTDLQGHSEVVCYSAIDLVGTKDLKKGLAGKASKSKSESSKNGLKSGLESKSGLEYYKSVSLL